MSKSVLIIDTPEYCGECIARSFCSPYGNVCRVTGENIKSYYMLNNLRPDYCPLRRLTENNIMYDDENKTVYRVVVKK